jgi:hypothetical protein
MAPPTTSNRRIPIGLIVGVTIFAVLLGLIIPAFQLPEHPARKAEAANDLEQLCDAINAYHTDCGVYPINPAVRWKDCAVYGMSGGHHNFELINTLRADGTNEGPNYGNALNTHQTVYLDVPNVRDSANPKDGLGAGTETDGRNIRVPGEWYDPWGRPYTIMVDMTGKGFSNLGFIYSDLAKPDLYKPPVGVVGITFGADGQLGSHGNGKYDGSDDIVRPDPRGYYSQRPNQ